MRLAIYIYSGLFDLIFSHYKHARIADSDAASSPWVLFLSAALVEVFVVESSAVSMNERSYAYVIRNSNNFGLLQCYKICKKEQYLQQLHSHTTAVCSQFASKATFFKCSSSQGLREWTDFFLLFESHLFQVLLYLIVQIRTCKPHL